ncbi:MAG: helix-turn-helix domain-containing protein [Promethearchaeota archaeon]
MVSEEIESLIVNLLKKGISINNIIKKTGISKSTIYRIRNKVEIINENDTGKVSGEKEDIFTVDERIKYNLNRIAEIGGRTYQELFEEIDFTLSEYDKITNRPTELFNYTIYLADVLMKLKINDENKILDFLLKAESENIELEELEQKLESIKENSIEEIEYYKNQTSKMEQEYKILLQSYTKFKILNSFELNKYMKGNKGIMDKIGKEYIIIMQQNQGLIRIIKNIDPKIIENIVEKIRMEPLILKNQSFP